MIEQEVEDYLCAEVRKSGGEVRKAEWIGRKHCPDRRVMHPSRCCWVEVKRPGAKPRPGQQREHERMRSFGEDVIVIASMDEVDAFIRGLGD